MLASDQYNFNVKNFQQTQDKKVAPSQPRAPKIHQDYPSLIVESPKLERQGRIARSSF